MQAPDRGTLVTWKQDKSFGFIRPDEGGKDVFVHARDFGNIGRAPRIGDVVRYQCVSDGKGRFRAADIQVEGLTRGPPIPRGKPRTGRPERTRTQSSGELASPRISWTIVVIFTGLVLALTVYGNLPVVAPAAYLIASLVTFLLYAFDKSAAMNSRWRTSENALLIAGLLCGWPGALVAQGMFRHKTSKRAFLVPFWITVGFNCAGLYWASTDAGAGWIRALVY